MAKNGHETNQVKKSKITAAKSVGKSACYSAVATAAVKEAQRDNKERNIPNWYLVNGKLVSDRGSTGAASVKTAARAPQTANGKRTKTVK